MELLDKFRTLAKDYMNHKEKLKNNEAQTKIILVEPFIKALGYGIYNPDEVIREFTADFGEKAGKKVDYAIMQNGDPIVLIEAKSCDSLLKVGKEAQLQFYFNATSASVGILTNGSEYRFYTDLEAKNKMDQQAFFEFSIDDIDDSVISKLENFTRDALTRENISFLATTLKGINTMKELLDKQLSNPSKEFIKYMARSLHTGNWTDNAYEKYKDITQEALKQFIKDHLKSALEKEKTATPSVEEKQVEETILPQEAIDAFNIVRAILWQKVDDIERVRLRPAKNDYAVLLDNTTHKPLCRFCFSNDPVKRTFTTIKTNKEKHEHSIEKPSSIYKYANLLLETMEHYLKKKDSYAPHESDNGVKTEVDYAITLEQSE